MAITEEEYLAAKYILWNGADPNLGVLGGCLNIAITKMQYYLILDLIEYGANI